MLRSLQLTLSVTPAGPRPPTVLCCFKSVLFPSVHCHIPLRPDTVDTQVHSYMLLGKRITANQLLNAN